MSGTSLDRWTEARETLSELIDWLDEVRQWSGSVAGHEPVDEEVRQAAQAFQAAEPVVDPVADRSPLDLHEVVSEMTALRQEVKLQTRAARQDRELSAKAVEQLGSSLAELERWRSDESTRRDAAVAEARQSTAESLIDLHDALSRSNFEAERISLACVERIQALGPRLNQSSGLQRSRRAFTNTVIHSIRSMFARLRELVIPADAPASAGPAGTHLAVPHGSAGDCPELAGSISNELAEITARLEGLTEGHSLAMRRFERLLAEFGVESIDANGRAVDPEQMEVVQSVEDARYAPGVVVAEIRRGYRQHGRVIRFAQVVVNRTNT